MTSITIIHGENTVLSRGELTAIITKVKASGGVIISVDGAKVSPAELHTQLGSASLFGDERTIVIERLWSQKSLTRKKELLELVAQTETPVILWHAKTIPVTQLKALQKKQPKVSIFKSSPETYKTLELLGSKDAQTLVKSMHASCSKDSPEFVFAMCVKRVRDLLLAACGEQLSGAPFAQQKVRVQVARFSLPKLLMLHQGLVQMDRGLKTSTSVLSLEQFLTAFALRTTQ